MKRSAGFIFIFGDIKQIVAARSVVNIKISFVVPVASVSCSLSESQQPSFFFLFLGCCQTLKTETPPPIIHSWKDFRCLTWQIWVLFWFFFLPYAVMQDAGGKKEGIWKQTWTACCGLNRHIKLSICRPLTRLLIRLLTWTWPQSLAGVSLNLIKARALFTHQWYCIYIA